MWCLSHNIHCANAVPACYVFRLLRSLAVPSADVWNGRNHCRTHEGIFAAQALEFPVATQKTEGMSKWGRRPELSDRGWTLGSGSVRSFLSISAPPPTLSNFQSKAERSQIRRDNHRLIRGCIGSRLTLRRSSCALTDTRRASLKHECAPRAGVIMVHNDTSEKHKNKKSQNGRVRAERSIQDDTGTHSALQWQCWCTETDTNYFNRCQFSH